MYKAEQQTDLRPFNLPTENLKVLYGLPKEVRFCNSCVISNQRPNSAVEYSHIKESKKETIKIEGGVCDACKFAHKKNNLIDWQKRDQELRQLCDRFRKTDGSYDCLVPGSGGKDSFYAAHILKAEYGMHPLTVTWAPHIYTPWGWQNFQSWIHAGFDNYLCTPNGKVHRLLTRLAVENLLHPFQPFIIGQKALAPKMAAKFEIPLVFYGENEAEYGNPVEDTEKSKRDWSYYTAEDQSKIFLGGTSLADLKENFGLVESDLDPYYPLSPEQIDKHKIEVHYLGYYLRWHPQSCYYYAVENGNFIASPERTPGTYSKYNSIDDKMDDFHYYTTFIKFGLGRSSYDASQEVRSGDITRDEAVALVNRFDGEWPERFAKELFEYLSIPASEYPEASKMFEQPIMNKEYFDLLCEKFRSPHLWKHEHGKWSLRHTLS